MEQQFSVLRDGDRFYYEIETALSFEEIEEIKNTSLSDRILRNTTINDIKENVFFVDDFTSSISEVKKLLRI